MNSYRGRGLSVTLMLLMLGGSAAGWSAGEDQRRKQPPGSERRGDVLDRRHSHDRYYPPRGRVINRLPPHYHVVPDGRHQYYFSAGIWYRPSGSHFTVVLPPVGLVVPYLPPYYSTVWVGRVPYYYAGGVYYVWEPSRPGYVVTREPRQESIREPEEAASEELFIYPKKGQSEQQQAEDRYQCHRWGVEQTGFDPTRASGNVPADQYAGKYDDYQRAMRACLEARDYSVK